MQSNHDGRVERHREVEKPREVDQKREKEGENICRMDIQRLEEMLQAEREERGRLEMEKEKLRREKEMLEEQRERHGGKSLGVLAVRRNKREKTNSRYTLFLYCLYFHEAERKGK